VDGEMAALVLAAGASSRWGGAPKALLPVDGRSGVRRIAEICLADGFEPVAVVLGAHRGPIAHELRGLSVLPVEAENWEDGRTASIQAGLAALPPQRDVLFWPVDHPFVSPRTIDALLAARSTDLLGVWFIPTYEGRGGHPVLWRAPVREPIFGLRPDAPVRALLPEFGPQVRRVAVDDPGVVASVDSPEEYRQAVETVGPGEVL
jgi:molybdenum cofactor cytidylyltransferase